MLSEYIRERDEAIKTLNPRALIRFAKKWRPELETPTLEVAKIAVCKMALATVGIDQAIKDKATKYLVKHGCSLSIYNTKRR